jgi:hypothetical protein
MPRFSFEPQVLLVLIQISLLSETLRTRRAETVNCSQDATDLHGNESRSPSMGTCISRLVKMTRYRCYVR